MQKTIYILLGIGIIGLLLYFMPIQIKLKIIRKKEDDLILIRYKSLYGILNLKFELPMLDIVFVNGKLSLKYKAEIESNKTNKLFKSFSKIFTPDDFQNIKRYFTGDKILLRRIVDYWLKHIVLRDLSIIIKFGLIDAALTAALCGVVWTLLGGMLSIMRSMLDMTTKNIVVAPIFDDEKLEAEISCIINFRLGDIINTGILVLKRHRELKKRKLSSDKPVNC